MGPDVRLALSAIAAELGVDPDELPPGITGVLRAFGAARYGEGARDFLWAIRGRTNRAFPAPIREDDVTPVMGKFGRRKHDDGKS